MEPARRAEENAFYRTSLAFSKPEISGFQFCISIYIFICVVDDRRCLQLLRRQRCWTSDSPPSKCLPSLKCYLRPEDFATCESSPARHRSRSLPRIQISPMKEISPSGTLSRTQDYICIADQLGVKQDHRKFDRAHVRLPI